LAYQIMSVLNLDYRLCELTYGFLKTN